MKKQLLGIFLLNIHIVSAQNLQQNIELQQLEIFGKFSNPKQNPASTEQPIVISREEIQKLPARSIDEVLQLTTGINIQRRGPYGVQSDVSIRGGGFDQVLFLLNGMPMNDAQTGHNSFHYPLDLQSVEKIEIIKGPSARRYGQNAFSGVINVITKTSAEKKTTITAEGGDYSSYQLGLQSHFGNKHIGNMLQLHTSSTQGYRENTDAISRNAFYQTQFALENGKLGLQAGISERKFGANGFYGTPKAKHQYEETQASIVGIYYQKRWNQLDLYSNIYWRRGQDMYLWVRHNPSLYRNMHIGNNIGGQINLSHHNALGVTGIGTEIRQERLQSSNLGQHKRLINQAFAQHHFHLGEVVKFNIIPGVSWSHISDVGNFWYPGIDVSIAFHQHSFFANAAKVHRIPSYTNLFYKSRTEKGNPSLKPESALSYEFGYEFLSQHTRFRASGFMKDSKDMIDFVRNSTNELWEANNIINVNIKGWEAILQQYIPATNSNISLGYTYLYNTSEHPYSYTKYSAENFRHQAIAQLTQNIGKNFYFQTSYRYQERQQQDKGYHLLDQKIGFKHNNVDAYLLVNNLTNTTYTEAFGVPMPKRWVHLGVKMNILY